MIRLVDIENLNNIIRYYSSAGLTGFDDPPNVHGSTLQVYGFNSINIDMSKNLQTWAKNKQEIFKLFGDQLKISIPLNDVVHSNSMVRSMLDDFIDENAQHFNLLIISLLKGLQIEEIIDNKLKNHLEILDVKLSKGWKISRCFKVLELDPIKLEKAQTLYSQFLQKLKIKGQLILSIDPIDFITMSCNKSGWTSCHHPSGCYGTGSLSYMNDRHTIISYITTDNDYQFEVVDTSNNQITNIRFKDKLWRQISYLNTDLDYAIQARQYPNESYLYNKEVTNTLIKLLANKKPELTFQEESMWVDEDNFYWLQCSNPFLRRKMFYNDITNTSFDKAHLIYPSIYQTVADLELVIKNENRKNSIIVGEKFYCACGCGSANFTKRFLVEDVDDEDYDDDDGYYEDDED